MKAKTKLQVRYDSNEHRLQSQEPRMKKTAKLVLSVDEMLERQRALKAAKNASPTSEEPTPREPEDDANS
jgi:hypothetical protein